MDGFIQKVGFAVDGMQITQYIAENVFQLDPPPPELSENCTANDYIRIDLSVALWHRKQIFNMTRRGFWKSSCAA